ncbi:MAG: 50S ribosomal protein L18 [Verrucomicrobia bacterium GWF2_51_19]|nr:MAG: 50S ribosomal protein L18 [Verrucomicrobia bacterium GWF2_51_19]HCJ12588.1 50S ribosomal protein L18 [Opitutae bacterium]
MNKVELKKTLLQKRCWRIRKKVAGTAERPRLSLRLSNKHMYAQCVDDTEGKTLFALSSLAKDLRSQNLKPNMDGVVAFAKLFGEKAKTAGVQTIVFDRGGRRYHGTVKAFADTVREAGLLF